MSASSRPSSSTTPSSEDAPRVRAGPGRRGSAIILGERGKGLIVADEDRSALWTIDLPLGDSDPRRIDLPGRPAQAVMVSDRVLVTIRDPGSLLVLSQEGKEQQRVDLPADAWGLAVTPDETMAVVTSAWSHRVSGVDLSSGEVRFSVDVAREPRGVIISASGDHAYVTHLVGSDITRIDWTSDGEAKARRVVLPAAPARSGEAPLAASLGYDAVLSPDGRRLFAARQALGALGRLQTWQGEASWFGAATVDILDTKTDAPVAPERAGRPITRLTDFVKPPADDRVPIYAASPDVDGPFGMIPATHSVAFTQPRAIVYRHKTNTLLVASEGTDEIVELDALAIAPADFRIKRYRIGADYGKGIAVADSGGAPSGIALSPDESTAYVFCRTTFEVAAVPLVDVDQQVDPHDTKLIELAAEDPLLEGVSEADPKRSFFEAASLGRKLFHSAIDAHISRGLACAGCHPDGRDDGHVWLEVDRESKRAIEPFATYLGSLDAVRHLTLSPAFPAFLSSEGHRSLRGEPRARQTLMLAGRMKGGERYGWRGESDGLPARIAHGFSLHRWYPAPRDYDPSGQARALAAFVLSGLVAPPQPERALTEIEARGKELFDSSKVGCTACHLPEQGYQNGATASVGLPGAQAGFADETDAAFKVPSLRFVGGTPPYFHDGSVATLERLVQITGKRMGNTAQLTAEDQAALVAFMRTL